MSRVERGAFVVGTCAVLGALAIGAGCSAVLGLGDLKDRSATSNDAGPQEDADAGPTNPDAVGATKASKVDLLLVIDESSAMADKQKLLADALPDFITNLFTLTPDLHIGVIGSSLGGMGGDICPDNEPTNAPPLRVDGPTGPIASATTKRFIEFSSATTQPNLLANDVASLIRGVGQNGCGLPAPLESAYRFLVQPNPWSRVTTDAQRGPTFVAVESDVLSQRKAFLRPDSLLVVLMLTHREDASIDPFAFEGRGADFLKNKFPGSPNTRADGKTTTAPRATSACVLNPASPECTSCAFGATCDVTDPACIKLRTDANCTRDGGFYASNEEQLRARFHRMKERYGEDPQYPIRRYVDGLTKTRVPDRDNEHVIKVLAGKTVFGPYVETPTCMNPLFAASLPGPGEELCNLPRGPRGKELVLFALLGGVPESLVRAAPNWQAILGKEPDAFDFTGRDTHMLQSTDPRFGVVSSDVQGDNGTDPIQGRDWNTNGNDLQYACAFLLPSPRNCSATTDPNCDCGGATNPPLCDGASGAQVRAKAYPTPRALGVAKGLEERAVVGSVCPASGVSPNVNPTGYGPTLSVLAARLAPRLAK